MRPETLATLEHLEGCNWFAHVGTNDTESAIVLRSWDKALRSCNSGAWEEIHLGVSAGIRLQIRQRDADRAAAWNSVALEMRPVAEALVSRKITAVTLPPEDMKTLRDQVSWDIAHLFIEAEYSDVVPPAFYASLGYWYAQGRFPCGWKGKFPKGAIVIY